MCTLAPDPEGIVGTELESTELESFPNTRQMPLGSNFCVHSLYYVHTDPQSFKYLICPKSFISIK